MSADMEDGDDYIGSVFGKSSDKLSPEVEALIEEWSGERTKARLRDFARKVIDVASTKDYEGMRHFQAKFIEASSMLESAREEIASLKQRNAELNDHATECSTRAEAAEAALEEARPQTTRSTGESRKPRA